MKEPSPAITAWADQFGALLRDQCRLIQEVVYKTDAFGGALLPSSIGTAAATFFTPIWVTQAESWDTVSLGVTVAGSTGAVIRAGIYNDDGFGRPQGSLVADLGTQTATAIAIRTWSVPGGSQARQPGLYHLAFKVEGAPTTGPTVRALTGPYANSATDAPGTISSGYYALSTAGAYPDPGLAATPGSGFRPLGFVHVSSRP